MGLQYCVEELVAKASRGDEEAWRDLWDHVEDSLEAYVGNPKFMNGLGKRVSDRRKLIQDVMQHLRVDGMQRLKAYVAMPREDSPVDFDAWLRVLARRAGLAYRRGETKPIAEGVSAEALRRAARVVPEPALSALELWMQSASFDDIARELGLAHGASDAERLVRTAIERLRGAS